MEKQKELIRIIKDEILVDIAEHMDYLFELIATKKATPEDFEELEEVREMKKEFDGYLEDLNLGDVSEDEIAQMIEEIREVQEL